MKKILEKILPDFLFIAGFAVVAIIYCSPVLNNKALITNDPLQSLGLAKEAIDFKAQSGELTWWTNSSFGGMPTYFISSEFKNGLFALLGYIIRPLPGGFPTNDIFWALIGGYILFMSFQKNRWLATIGAFGFVFCSLTILYLEAGHSSKIQALAFAPMVIAGILYAFKNQRLKAVLAFSIGLGFEINANHMQITYYLVLACFIFVCFLLYYALKEKRIKPFLINLSLIGIAGIFAVGTQSARLLSTLEYSKETIRGTSELTLDSVNANSNSKGLSKDYAFSWSYGKVESFSFLIPEFSGGASSGTFPKNSSTAKALSSIGVPASNIPQFIARMPSYWGDQDFVAGPAYLGAILCFLFILGLLISKSKLKIPLFVCTLILLFISWGDNFQIFGYFMFDYIPMYNKFRAVSMAISLMQLFLVSLGILAIIELLKENLTLAELKKPLIISFSLTAGLCLLFAIIPSLFFNFTSLKDPAFIQSLTQSFGGNAQAVDSVYTSILEDRETLVKNDSLRSFVYILLASLLILAFLKKKMKSNLFLFGFLFLICSDLWLIDKRYFNDSDFQTNRSGNIDSLFPKTAADEQILQDKDPNFRVLNTTAAFWSSGKESYYHKSIGGYHGAKLKRAQELYEHAMIKEGRLNMPILNMLNTKYFIVNGDNGTQAQMNPEALGNAWYVDSVIYAGSANEEMTILASLDTKKNVVIDQRFKDALKGQSSFISDSSSIRLTEYLPNNLKYQSHSSNEGFVVFSEMYYRGNDDWKSYVDGIEVPHLRVNYALRGLALPAGTHEIEFKFRPKVITIGNRIDFFSSILFSLFIIGIVFYTVRSGKNKETK